MTRVVHRPHPLSSGAEAYPSIHGMAAALLHSLARNHALVDELVMVIAADRLDDVESIAARRACSDEASA